jgi:outer membrane protein TolC
MCGLFCLGVGCRSHSDFVAGDVIPVSFESLQVEVPDVEIAMSPKVAESLPPRTLRNPGPTEDWPLTLEDAIQIALTNSSVMRDVGGRLIRTPLKSTTHFDPAIQEADPRYGVEAALSAFDAELSTRLFYGGGQRDLNNLTTGLGVVNREQYLGGLHTGVTKTTAVGTRLALRSITDYDRNNSPVNRFPSGWDTFLSAEFSHPLLRGGGLDYNRIAGPNAAPGEYNGVLVARIRGDIKLADFELGVRDLVRDVERAYWELYFAYRALDARRAAYQQAVETWQLVQARVAVGQTEGYSESLARERIYDARAAVENMLNGEPVGSPNRTPVSSVLLDVQGGVYSLERRLRHLTGLPANDGHLIRPADEPPLVDVTFNWHESQEQAVFRRPELRKQRWSVKQRELELLAAKNLLLPEVNLVGHYRLYGFGDSLTGGSGPNSSATRDLLTDAEPDFLVGVEVRSPIGNRQGHLAVRHAELQLARENTLYHEQESQVSHELAAALAELDRAHVVANTQHNRRVAAHQRRDAMQTKFLNRAEPEHDVLLEFLLNAQQRAAAADQAYFRALTDHHLAISKVHLTRGTLLRALNIHLTEGPWTEAAVISAEHQSHRFRPSVSRRHHHEPSLSRGAFPQGDEHGFIELPPLDAE